MVIRSNDLGRKRPPSISGTEPLLYDYLIYATALALRKGQLYEARITWVMGAAVISFA